MTFPDLAPAEWLRPWKLLSFALGMGWLIWGALTLDIADWDIGVSILMGGFTYLLAPWSARVLLHRRWPMLPLALLAWWWCVDGVYMAWHGALGHQTFREANFYASSCLYWLCGFIWLPKAPLWRIVRHPRSVPY
jgi:hypothetical protein